MKLFLLAVTFGACLYFTWNDPSVLHVFLLALAWLALVLGIGMVMRGVSRETPSQTDWDEVEFQEFLRALDRTRGDS